MKNYRLNLPQGWDLNEEVLLEDGFETTNIFCSADGIQVDMYLGDMPDGSDAEEQAFANYADMVGWDQDDENSPLFSCKFNGKRCFGFDFVDEDTNTPVRFLSTEIKAGTLLVMTIAAKDDKAVEETQKLFESRLRIEA